MSCEDRFGLLHKEYPGSVTCESYWRFVYLAATFVVPALAQETQKKGSDADEAFMTGIRKIGVMTGQAYACSKEAEQPQIGQGAIDLATQVALHFGLQAAFVYSGSFGYGIGHEFDHAICPQAIADFKALQAKYLGR